MLNYWLEVDICTDKNVIEFKLLVGDEIIGHICLVYNFDHKVARCNGHVHDTREFHTFIDALKHRVSHHFIFSSSPKQSMVYDSEREIFVFVVESNNVLVNITAVMDDKKLDQFANELGKVNYFMRKKYIKNSSV